MKCHICLREQGIIPSQHDNDQHTLCDEHRNEAASTFYVGKLAREQAGRLYAGHHDLNRLLRLVGRQSGT